MELNFKDKPGGSTPTTRMYAPESKAKKNGQKRKPDSRASREIKEDTYAVDEDGYRIRIPTSQVKRSSRIGIIFSGFLLAGMILFTLTGYERIARAYADVNALNDEIEQTNLRIVGLNVEIECAVTIQQAQEAASRFNMVFPDTSDSTHYQKISGDVKFPDEVLYPALTADTADTAAGGQTTGDAAANQTAGAVTPDAPQEAAPQEDTGDDGQ